MSAFTPASLVDSYDIRSVHDLYRDELPVVERHAPVAQLDVAGLVGAQIPPIETGAGVAPRWWFVAEEGSELFQVQENFVANNWRRQKVQPGAKVNYPGFDYLQNAMRRRVETLRTYHAAHSEGLVEPVACELLYDNVIPLRFGDGPDLRVSDVLSEYDRAEPDRKLLGLQLNWIEKIDGLADDEKAILQIEIAIVAIMVDGSETPMPVVRILFRAGAMRSTWADTFTFFEVAHTHIRHRLMVLTTEEAHFRWLPK